MPRSLWNHKTSWVLYDWEKMKKVIILIPVFNDWLSLEKLIKEISVQIDDIRENVFDLLVINDGSTSKKPSIALPKNIKQIKIINMKTNRGHAECISYGLRFISKKEKFDKVILMDGDGEDRPEEIKDLLNKSSIKDGISVVAKRVKRSEGLIFKILYEIHKLITLILTGKKINFGNYSCLSKNDIKKICENPNLWSSFSGTFKQDIKNYYEINCIRGSRYFGPSKMSLIKLIYHSLSIISVFKYEVLIRSLFIFIISYFSKEFLGSITLLLQLIIIIFYLTILFVMFINKKKLSFKTDENIDSIDEIVH